MRHHGGQTARFVTQRSAKADSPKLCTGESDAFPQSCAQLCRCASMTIDAESFVSWATMNVHRLELHYHLRDGSHSMNAVIRNKCEAEALAAFQYIAAELGIEVLLETTAHTEGGLKEVWAFVTKTENFLAANFLILLIATFWNYVPPPDKEMEALNKEVAKATIEEKKLSIEKLKQELRRERHRLPWPKKRSRYSNATSRSSPAVRTSTRSCCPTTRSLRSVWASFQKVS